jgi:adenosylmethionine-8-amino-7-oxononanoate aminotransferase
MKRSNLIKPILDEEYPIIDYGKGVYLYDLEGKEYLDVSSGAVIVNIGHGVRKNNGGDEKNKPTKSLSSTFTIHEEVKVISLKCIG